MDPERYRVIDAALGGLVADPAVGRAREALRDADAETIETQIELCEIPAPPFGEAERGGRFAELLTDAGLAEVRTDPAGNVLGLAAGSAGRETPLVVAAHLDTVFPAGTDVRITRQADLLRGPGISDDARGLAAVVALARALERSGCRTETPVLFVGTVGEEGAGDLRGVKHLFGNGGDGRGAAAFISLDGAGLDRIVTRGLGSTRYRITARGPGGHSWVDWGTPNPIHLLSRMVARLTALRLTREPQTTLTVARWGGGTSINSIPQEAWAELDTRSESGERLEALEAEVRGVVSDVASEAGSGLEVEVETIGLRPGGACPEDHALVMAAVAATRAVGGSPELAVSSTDANIPMSLGIPAITIGCGGEAGKAHTTEEWYRNRGGVVGLERALYTVLLTVGLAD